MCIHVKNMVPLVADTDINCYKMLLHDTEEDTYIAPFVEMDYTQYVKGKTKRERTVTDPYTSSIDGSQMTIKEKCARFYEDRGKREVEYRYNSGGFIHTFVSEDKARECMRYAMFQILERRMTRQKFYMTKEAVLFKCVIPKGTTYLSGDDDDAAATYASETIRFGEIIIERLTDEEVKSYEDKWRVETKKAIDCSKGIRGDDFDSPFICYDNIRHLVTEPFYRYIVLRWDDELQGYRLPYVSFYHRNEDERRTVSDEMLQGKEPLRFSDNERVREFNSELSVKALNVLDGFIPLFSDYLTAVDYVKERNIIMNDEEAKIDYVIYECLIKRGTPYYINSRGTIAVKEAMMTHKMKIVDIAKLYE